uniref:Uncharacterized protein n=1 Tax=Opuntia streptacantha TaxID=393608 RepID=A0A7C8YRX9_OPUST
MVEINRYLSTDSTGVPPMFADYSTGCTDHSLAVRNLPKDQDMSLLVSFNCRMQGMVFQVLGELGTLWVNEEVTFRTSICSGIDLSRLVTHPTVSEKGSRFQL